MEMFDAICTRLSVREYQDATLDKEVLVKLVDAGRRAPTARAVEPWEFVIITKKETLVKLSKLTENGRFIKDASAAIVVFCSKTKYYLEDGCAATENILLAAAGEGLGACWIAGDKKDYARDVCSLLSAKESIQLVSIISIGIPKNLQQQRKTRKLEEVIHWEKF